MMIMLRYNGSSLVRFPPLSQLEALADVERAFVHVDYEKRDQPEHRTERLLQGLPVLREGSLESSAENPSPKGAS